MSIIGKILDIFGPGGNNFYARDFRNAYTFRPDQNPPRQKFQGYVSFVVNRELYGSTLYGNEVNSTFRLRLGSLVRSATLPEVEFKTETKNSYNRKRIVNTGVEYQPVDIKVFDTINNEWLTMFMKYFSYHYMNPRNKQFGDEREVGNDPRQSKTNQQYEGSKFGASSDNTNWNSNAYGYNLNELANFFERIDYVLYHGNKGVQYSLINPVLTRFRTGEIDYASSDVMEFDMTFEYESFTISEQVNFGLSDFDIARFENAKDFKGPAFVPFNVPVLLQERQLEMLSGYKNAEKYARSFQQQPEASAEIVVSAPKAPPSVYGERAKIASPAEKDKSFIGGLLSNIADNALSAAIHGTSIKNAVINTAVGGITQGIVNTIRPPVRGTRQQPTSEAETSSASTSEKPAVKPEGSS